MLRSQEREVAMRCADQARNALAAGVFAIAVGQANPYQVVPNHFKLPEGRTTGSTAAIDIDRDGGNTNARIVQFSPDCKFIKEWGRKGAGPGEFDAPHSLAMDSRGRLFVADRGNSRIQIFDQDGKFLAEWKQFGRPSGVFIDKSDIIYVADSQSSDKTNPGFRQAIRIGSAKDGKVTAFILEPAGVR